MGRFAARLLLASCAVFVVIAPARQAHAQADFVGTRALGMGEALRANAAGGAAPILNPAGMSLSKGYVIEGGYGFNIENLGHHAYVSVVDSVTARIAAGLFYEYIHSNPRLTFNWAGGRVQDAKLTRDGHVAGLSLSMAIADRFLVGATIKYLHFNTNAPLPEGTEPSELSLDSVNGVTFDVGVLIKAHPKLNLAVVGYNLWDHGSRETPASLGLGVAFIPLPQLSIDFDAVVNFTGYKDVTYTDDTKTVVKDFSFKATARLGPGVEWLIANKVPVRLGVLYDTGLSSTYLTAGLGYFGQTWAIDLSYRGKVSGGLENLLMLGLRIFIN